MTQEEFDRIVSQRCDTIKSSLIEKAKQYKREDNPLWNFEKGAKMYNQTSERTLYTFLQKHLICLDDLINDLDKGLLNEPVFNEVIKDYINYGVLLEAIIQDRINKSHKNQEN